MLVPSCAMQLFKINNKLSKPMLFRCHRNTLIKTRWKKYVEINNLLNKSTKCIPTMIILFWIKWKDAIKYSSFIWSHSINLVEIFSHVLFDHQIRENKGKKNSNSYHKMSSLATFRHTWSVINENNSRYSNILDELLISRFKSNKHSVDEVQKR